MTLTATIYDEGDRPIYVFGTYEPADPSVGLFEPDVDLEGAELDGAPYDLSKVEQDQAREALLEAHRDEIEKTKAQREDAARERREIKHAESALWDALFPGAAASAGGGQ